MVSIYWYEGDTNAAVNDLKRGLEGALNEIDADVTIPPFSGVRGFYDKNIKVNKLAYRAIEHFDLPIIRTWYRYGQFEPYDSLRPKKLEIGPLADPGPSASTIDYAQPPAIEEIMGYFLEFEIEQIWEQDLFEFLRENYTELAPEEYKDAYLANTGILEVLEVMFEDDSLPENARDHRDRIKEYSMDLRHELDSNSRFEDEVFEHLESFLYTLEDSLIALEHTAEPTGTQIQAVRRSRSIYHDYVWPWPAMIISLREAKGPKQDIADYSRRGREQLNDFRETFPRRVADWQDEVTELGLQPAANTYRSSQEGYSEEWRELEQAAMINLRNV